MDEAEQSVKELFNNLISEYRRLGVLEERLTNHFKVAWWPADQYDGDLEVEETAPRGALSPASYSRCRPAERISCGALTFLNMK